MNALYKCTYLCVGMHLYFALESVKILKMTLTQLNMYSKNTLKKDTRNTGKYVLSAFRNFISPDKRLIRCLVP